MLKLVVLENKSLWLKRLNNLFARTIVTALLVQMSQPCQAQAKPGLVYCGTIHIPGVLRHSARWRTQHYINSGSSHKIVAENVGEDILRGWYRLKLSKCGSVHDKKLN